MNKLLPLSVHAVSTSVITGIACGTFTVAMGLSIVGSSVLLGVLIHCLQKQQAEYRSLAGAVAGHLLFGVLVIGLGLNPVSTLSIALVIALSFGLSLLCSQLFQSCSCPCTQKNNSTSGSAP